MDGHIKVNEVYTCMLITNQDVHFINFPRVKRILQIINSNTIDFPPILST